MKQLQEQMELYRLSGGVHTSALADTKSLLVVAEDIGRHNTFDKIQGECLLRGISTRDRVLLTHRSRFVRDAAQGGKDAGPGCCFAATRRRDAPFRLPVIWVLPWSAMRVAAACRSIPTRSDSAAQQMKYRLTGRTRTVRAQQNLMR